MRSLLAALMAGLCSAGAAMATDREVSVPAGKGDIHGAVRIPAGFTGGAAVLVIAGSGPTDRDGDSAMGVHAGSYRLLADALETAGIPSLRYDKRGVGQSTRALIGDGPRTNAAAFAAEAQLRFTDFADDAAAFARLLAKEPGVRCVVILGHSEGSLLGMLAAQKVPVCGYVSLSGAGRPIDQVLLEQVAPQVSPAVLARVKDTIDQLKAGHTVAEPPLPQVFRLTVQPYMMSWLPLDPAVEVAKVRAPVLIVQGDNDLQVSVADADRLAKARPDAKLVVVKGMNHVLKDAPADRAGNVAIYADAQKPLSPPLVSAVVTFVKGLDPRH